MQPGTAGGGGDLARDRVLSIATPEHVRVEFSLAGPGSRFGALMIDLALALALILGGSVALYLSGEQGLIGPQLALALAGFFATFVVWSYFFLLELLRDGQTVGKRLFGIRVVLDSGQPLTAQAAAVRNLLRLIDLQPLPSCIVGGLSMLLDPKGRRLGDLAAGTVVVRDVEVEFPEVPGVSVVSAPPRLSDEAFVALENFVERAPQLPEAARQRLVQRLTASLAPRAPELDWHRDPGAAIQSLFVEERARRAAARLSTAAGSAAATGLLRVKRERWQALRESVSQLRRTRLRRLDEERVAEFAARYREVSADLARARTYGASGRTIFALEHLVATAHNLFYRPVGRGTSRLRAFLGGGFPKLVRELRSPIGVAALALTLPALVSFVLVSGDPDHERLLASAAMIERAETAAADPAADYRDTWEGVWMGHDALAAMLIANNVQVALLAFAGGLLGGLATLATLIMNGLHLGVALAVFANRGVLDNIAMFVLLHGPIELTAIVIAGGAGLWMGSAVWFPGRRTRRAALVERGRQAVALLAGVILLLVVAGLIEGFLSPSRLPTGVKLAVAGAAGAWLVTYLGLVGRTRAVPEGELRSDPGA
jgi:uncharacterized membrane protein SpoIIM required for sporulation/uncharacterized RDD family membrane protein YckC